MPGLWADAGAPTDPTTALLQYGVTGTVAALAIVGCIWLYKAVKQSRDEQVAAANERAIEDRRRADRLEAELARLNAVVQQQTMTTLGEASRALTEAMEALRRERDRGRDGR